MIDSFTHTPEGILDWHRNGERPFFLYLPFTAVNGSNQAPPEYLKKYAHLGGTGPRRAQLECMDIAIGQVLKAIQDKGREASTLVMFTNDNGGPAVSFRGSGPSWTGCWQSGSSWTANSTIEPSPRPESNRGLGRSL